jgi:hypothetical protein
MKTELEAKRKMSQRETEMKIGTRGDERCNKMGITRGAQESQIKIK